MIFDVFLAVVTAIVYLFTGTRLLIWWLDVHNAGLTDSIGHMFGLVLICFGTGFFMSMVAYRFLEE